MGRVIAPSLTAPVELERPISETDVRPDHPWITLVWNDPINLMSYVAYVFRAYFGYDDAESERRQHAPARQHVERRHDLREEAGVAVGDAGDEDAEPRLPGARRDVAQRRVRLEHLHRRGAHHLHLEPVVHHGDVRDADVLRRRHHVAHGRGNGGRRPGEGEVDDVDAELHGSEGTPVRAYRGWPTVRYQDIVDTLSVRTSFTH